MARPSFQNLSDALATAFNQTALTPNLPVMNLAERMRQIHRILQDVQEEQQNLQQEQQNLQHGLQNLQQRLQNLQEGQQQIQQDILHSDRNKLARLLNSSVTHADTPLEPLHGLDGQPIQNFPQTSREIKTLNGAMLNALLNSLALPTNGAVDTRRRRLMKHIGIIKV